jgi:1,4-dihydroxy-2-naphthoyl-CoA hydrolase
VPFVHRRTIRFADTDAAGVAYFANYLSICHEAYEEALDAAGIELKSFFDATGVIIPVAKSEVEYLRPLACGDKVAVSVSPHAISENTFELRFEIKRLGSPEKTAARARTEHVCIEAQGRKRAAVPPPLAAWIKSSG